MSEGSVIVRRSRRCGRGRSSTLGNLFPSLIPLAAIKLNQLVIWVRVRLNKVVGRPDGTPHVISVGGAS